MIRLVAIITARPSYSRIKTALVALRTRGVETQIITAGAANLVRYGTVSDTIRADGFLVHPVWTTYEGANLLTSVRETGSLVESVAQELARLAPDCALVVADRHEVLGAAMAVAYQHIPLIHIQGGERTGSIDDKVRHAITQLADLHLVATPDAARQVRRMRGEAEVVVTGCPSLDLCAGLTAHPTQRLMIIQHPVTDEADQAQAQMQTTLEACEDFVATVCWPGEDAGADGTAKAIRLWQPSHQEWMYLRSAQPRMFLELLCHSVVVGNSSVAIRECSYLGVPAVNIGTRQWGRERALNVMTVGHDVGQIRAAVMLRMAHGPFPSSTLYGDGHSGERIAEAIIQWRS